MATRNRELLRDVNPHVHLYRDLKTGIAWVEDGYTGMGHSCHPNIAATGNVAGMKNLGYWDKTDQTVRSHGWIYNVSHVTVTDELDELARRHCRCGGNHNREGRD